MTASIGKLVVLSVVTFSGVAAAQNSAAPIEYRAGQIWRYAGDITITVLKVDEEHRHHRIIHVRVENVPISACGEIHLTDNLDHIALTEKMLRKDTAVLIRENSQLPDSYFDAYRQWQKAKPPRILDKTSIGDLVRTAMTRPSPLICNFLPAETS